MGAVKNALQRDGMDPAIMDLDHDKSVASQLDPKSSDAKKLNIKKKPKVRRKKVYWNKIETIQEGTIWSVVRKLEVKLKHNLEEFEGLFAQAIDAKKDGEKKVAKETAAKSAKTVKVIE